MLARFLSRNFSRTTLFVPGSGPVTELSSVGTDGEHFTDLESYLERASAIELANRSLISAPVYAVISLIMLFGTPVLMNYGWWAVAEAALLVTFAVVRIVFALGFESLYERIGEKAVLQFSILTALQSLTLGVLAGIVIWQHWATQEVVLTIVLSAGCIAAGTSALSVRRSAQLIFLLCVLGPFGIAVFLVGGIVKTMLILGFLVLMAFLVQDGGQARKSYLSQLKTHYEDKMEIRRVAVESRAKKKFLKDIGYDLRTPVNSIIGLATLLSDENLGHRPREYIDLIQNSCHELLNLVNSVPGAVRFRPDTQDVEVGSVKLRRFVYDVMALYHPEAMRKNLNFSCQLGDLPDMVSFPHEGLLEQVLAHLIGNAVRFTRHGSVTLNNTCHEPVDGSMLIEFSVTDTGVGIPSEKTESLFDPFGSKLASLSGDADDGGLGLPLCKGLVELMGGDIRIESTIGEGTTVRFSIKAEMEPSVESCDLTEQDSLQTELEMPANLSLDCPHNILVVDDDDIHRKILCVQLAKMGYQVDEAKDGQQAIAAAMNSSYDLIFMDLQMPNMGGIQANRWIREHFNQENDLQIVAVTGEATREIRGACIKAGMDSFIPKPMQIDDLTSILKQPVPHT